MPSFQGYHGYPASICASVNEQIVHGIPSATRVLADGDLISVDCGAILDGWHGDAAVTIPVGDGGRGRPPALGRLRGGDEAGIAAALPGGRLTDISHAMQIVDRGRRPSATGPTTASSPEYGGHGIGTAMHMDPFLPNQGEPGHGPRLRAGHGAGHRADAHRGRPGDRRLDDGWTVVTADGSRAAHWEHTVAITDDGPRILTLPA